ncbi:hypothetical protein HanIR_Chr04g0185361 [Helianthus annuus]|nr:hypothetical protein HanIR_Chr04g0185361 [Helianthus annuus]
MIFIVYKLKKKKKKKMATYPNQYGFCNHTKTFFIYKLQKKKDGNISQPIPVTQLA